MLKEMANYTRPKLEDGVNKSYTRLKLEGGVNKRRKGRNLKNEGKPRPKLLKARKG